MRKFKFCKEGSLLVGLERECLLTDLSGNISPLAEVVLNILPDRSRFGYELSACQLEDRVGPISIGELESSIDENEVVLRAAERKIGFRRLFQEVAPRDMPLDVYPDPTGRYQRITQSMPLQILEAACRVTGTHVHIGMPDHLTALKVYNKVIKEVDRLICMGDGSSGERIKIYKVMAPDFYPPSYLSWEDFHEVAKKKGFDEDPRKCWNIIRISIHGTIEFRMFGTTADKTKALSWANCCYEICKDAMNS